MTGCVFYIVDAFLDFGLEHNRNLNELILYFLFYYLDSFSLINFRSVSCGEGSLSPLWQMSLFRRSGGEKKWQDSSWDPCHCHCRRKKSRAPTLCKTFQYIVHELALQALLSKRQCVRHFPIFRTLVPTSDSGTRITLLQITSSSQCFWTYLHPLIQIRVHKSVNYPLAVQSSAHQWIPV